jgi:hypothetical protein
VSFVRFEEVVMRRVPLYAFARAKMIRLLKVLLPAALAIAALLTAGASVASTPSSSSVTVPTTVGQTETRTWAGTIPAGANPTSSCAGIPDPLVDKHAVAITVPSGAYANVDATFTFTITWEDATNDEILTVIDPDGATVGSSDGGTSTETVVATNLAGGTYQAVACAFAAPAPVAYSGRLVVTTTAPEASVPSADAQGLAFSASVAADNQRDQAEPLLEIDKAGYAYDCGPSGSSMLSDYAQVSPPHQHGDQFHLLGTPPRGQQAGGGGGDCGLAFGTQQINGSYPYAYTGLGPLTGFVSSTSPNNGRSLTTGGPVANGFTDEGVLADRQWMTFVDPDTVLLIYNQQQPRNVVVQRSDNSGLTYGPDAVRAARNPRFPGPIRYIEPTAELPNGLVYFPWDRGATNGNQINISFSTDRGATWRNCGGAVAPGTTTLFVTADHDSAGNIYVVYGENAKFHTYMVSTSAAKLLAANPACPDPTASTDLPPMRAGLFSSPVQVDRDGVRSTVFQWVTAGAPGRVAVVFAGTETDGNPNTGTFKATWNIYVNQSLNANAADATFSQVKATTHPFHYDSICLNGLGCDLSVPPGDRSMADFFALDYNPVDKRIYVTFNRSNKKPDDAVGVVASPMVVTQIAGPSLGGGTVAVPDRTPLRTSSTDLTGDALSGYSFLGAGPVPPPDTLSPQTNEPAGDFQSATIGPEIDLVSGSPIANGGFTVTLKVANLSTAELTNAMTRTGSQSLLWIWRFTNGHQDAAASARWNPVQGFTFGYNDFATGDSPCVAPSPGANPKCIVYPGDTPIQGDVNQATGTIRLSVPRMLLRALSGPTGHGERPAEVPATTGSRLYDATAFSLGNSASALQPPLGAQSFLYPLDNTPAFDFLVPSGGGGGGGGGGAACKITGAGSIASGKFTLSAHATLPPKGNNAYRDPSTDFNSRTITAVTCAGRNGTITGTGVNGNDAVQFEIRVVDNGEAGTSDTYRLDLMPGGTRQGTLTKGNIQIHSS